MKPGAPRRFRLLVTHPDPILRAGLVAALCREPAFETIVDGLDSHVPHQSRADVVITDYASAMTLAPQVLGRQGALARVGILVVTTNEREVDIRRALEAGVHGYLVLGCPLAELIECASRVASGLRYLSRSVSQRMADILSHPSLTSREMEVLGLVVAGLSNKAIARELEIEPATVKTHMTAIMTKLGATSRTHAAAVAAMRGLIEQRAKLRQLPDQRRGCAPEAGTQRALAPRVLLETYRAIPVGRIDVDEGQHPQPS